MALEDYERLKKMLLEHKKWPLLYMFKFIVPNSDNRVQMVVDLLPSKAPKSFKHTKNLKHVSVTCKCMVNSAEEIIAITDQISKIPGVIAL
jgi:hypothetical protein